MSLVSITTLSDVTISHILHVQSTHREGHDFYVVFPDGTRERFHSMSEPRSDERDGVETAIKRMSEQLGIPFKFDEVFEDEDDD